MQKEKMTKFAINQRFSHLRPFLRVNDENKCTITYITGTDDDRDVSVNEKQKRCFLAIYTNDGV